MMIAGIDPGLKATGYGFLDFSNSKISIIAAGTIEPKVKDPLSLRINAVYRNLEALVKKYKPEVMVLEKLYAHYKHPTTACIMGHVRGVICLLCAQHNVKLIESSVKRIRQAITGNGNATKLQTQSVVAHMLCIDQSRLTLDASDALALGLGYTQILRRKI